MLNFDQRNAHQSDAFECGLKRLSALVADMEQIRRGTPIEHLSGDAPILDRWLVGQRAISCLVGLSTGHPRLAGENRPIVTSDLWLMSQDRQWARTLSRWYRLGRPAETFRHDA